MNLKNFSTISLLIASAIICTILLNEEAIGLRKKKYQVSVSQRRTYKLESGRWRGYCLGSLVSLQTFGNYAVMSGESVNIHGKESGELLNLHPCGSGRVLDIRFQRVGSANLVGSGNLDYYAVSLSRVGDWALSWTRNIARAFGWAERLKDKSDKKFMWYLQPGTEPNTMVIRNVADPGKVLDNDIKMIDHKNGDPIPSTFLWYY